MRGLTGGPFGVNLFMPAAPGDPAEVAGYAATLQADGKIILAGYAYVTSEDFALARYISGLNMGILDLSTSNNSILIYPNPVKQNATLEYTLKNPEEITIQLLDLQGKVIKTFLDCENQPTGEHQQILYLPEELASGSYLIVISSAGRRESIKIIK